MNWFLKTRNFVKKNEKYITPIALFGGFIIDSLTLQRIDLLFENVVLASYLILSGLLVLLISFIDSKEIQNKFIIKIRPFLGIALLFVFGGIFSGFTVFYTRSASILSSWPFLLLLVLIMVGTEYMKKFFTKMTFQVVVFYFALFSYLIFIVPIVVKRMGNWIFILSGVLSLALIYLYIRLFQKVIGSRFHNTKINIWRSVAGVFVLINILYFTNIIPPVPLSLKDADIFHYVERVNGDYQVLDEENSFWNNLTFSEKIHIRPGESLYMYSSVFAPTKLNTKISHEWQFKNDDGDWVTSGDIPFPIYGGSDTGYRGYSVKSSLAEGNWRVNIKTPNGQTVGRKKFEVVFTDNKQTLVSKVK